MMIRCWLWSVLLLFVFGRVWSSTSLACGDQALDERPTFVPLDRANVPPTALAISPDDQYVLGASAAGVQYWRWPSLELVGELGTEMEAVLELKFSPRTANLAIVGGIAGEVGQIELWDWEAKRLRTISSPHEDLIMQADWSDDGRHLATASFDGTCGIWDWETERLGVRFDGHSRPVLAIRYWGPDHVLSAGVDQSIRSWQSSTQVVSRTLDNHLGAVTGMLLESNPKSLKVRRMISIGEDKTVRLWQPEIGRMIRFQKLASKPTAAIWDHASESVLIGCDNGQVYRLEQESLKTVAEYEPGVGSVRALAVHRPTGRIVVAGRTGLVVTSVRANGVGPSSQGIQLGVPWLWFVLPASSSVWYVEPLSGSPHEPYPKVEIFERLGATSRSDSVCCRARG